MWRLSWLLFLATPVFAEDVVPYLTQVNHPGDDLLARRRVIVNQKADGLRVRIHKKVDIDDELWARLNRLPPIAEMELEGQRVGDDAIRRIAHFDRLVKLEIEKSAITDEGLALLSGLKSLRDLELTHISIGGDGLKHLAKINGLTQLFFVQVTFPAEGLAELASLKKLTHLGIGVARTDAVAVMKSISQITSLQGLGVGPIERNSALSLSDEAMAHLVPLQNLKSLGLGQVEFSKEGMKSIVQLQSLTRLNVRAHSLSAEEVAMLQRLPKLIDLDVANVDRQELRKLSGLQRVSGPNFTLVRRGGELVQEEYVDGK